MNILCFMLGFILCGFIVFLYNLRWVAAARRRRKREAEKDPTKKTQATKIIVFSIMITYYIAFAVAVWVVIAKDIYQLSSLLTFTGGVAACAVPFLIFPAWVHSKGGREHERRAEKTDCSGSGKGYLCE